MKRRPTTDVDVNPLALGRPFTNREEPVGDGPVSLTMQPRRAGSSNIYFSHYLNFGTKHVGKKLTLSDTLGRSGGQYYPLT